MLWIALRPGMPSDAEASSSSLHDPTACPPEQQALAWWALQFSPRVCMVEEAVLLEVDTSLRLFGGKRALLQRLRDESALVGATGLTVAPTSLSALALLRTLPPAEELPIPAISCTERTLQSRLDSMSLVNLSATREHLPVLERLGCRTLGQLRALPRGGVSRRFGAALLEALDRAYGLRPDAYEWIVAPEQFSARLEFNGRIEVAEGLLFGARRLLGQLAGWLLARQRGVVSLTLHWEHDLVRRGDLTNGHLLLRTAEATRDTLHLARLLGEHLARVTLPAPVQAIRLEATETQALETASASLLPEDLKTGEPLRQLIERISARLGEHRVLRGQIVADHRPQRMQKWMPACEEEAGKKTPVLPRHLARHPPWILRDPLRLAVQGDRPLYQGALVMLAGPDRLESGWWSLLSSAEAEGDKLALRDYYIASSPHAGLLWVYRRRSVGEPAWYLQGVYG